MAVGSRNRTFDREGSRSDEEMNGQIIECYVLECNLAIKA
jgi:hypothetical protein